MIDNVLTIKTGFSDLLPMPEFYQVVTYSQKREELLSLIYEKKNFKPFASMKLIREINFLIKKTITLWKLQCLAERIEKLFGISCFQISIDRENNTAYMLCSWIDKETGECIVLNRTEQKRLSVLVLDFLDLPRPRGADMWLRYFLLNKYNNDPSVYSKQIESLERGQYDSLSYPVIRDSLKYVEMLCRGLLK